MDGELDLEIFFVVAVPLLIYPKVGKTPAAAAAVPPPASNQRAYRKNKIDNLTMTKLVKLETGV